MILLDPGAGEMLKAAIVQQVQAIGICKSAAHKNFLMDILKSFVKSQNLVNLVADAPKKPRELLEFESKQTQPRGGGGGPSAAAGPSMPKAAVPQKADEKLEAAADAPQETTPRAGVPAGKKNLFAFGNTSL